MQFAAKVAVAGLNETRNDTRSEADWHAIRPGAIAKLLLRCCAVLMALGSIAAVSLMGALSFGCYGAAILLARVGPLRHGYQFLSRAYDRFLGWLGQKVLRDSRDTPALR